MCILWYLFYDIWSFPFNFSYSQSEIRNLWSTIPSRGWFDRERNCNVEKLFVRCCQMQGHTQSSVPQGIMCQVYSRNSWKSQSPGQCISLCIVDDLSVILFLGSLTWCLWSVLIEVWVKCATMWSSLGA